ncbi:MAG: acetate--CoA ligase family protein, partial [Candidatus Thermoplasmatota archaeon]|nr:acetate--CoA ligase family protein [Candidatus Thermoplasmatota archaeon]
MIESEMRKVLQIAGIPMAEGKIVRSLEGCLNAAEKIGYPVVLKVVSEDIVHKMDVGGVAVNLESKEEVEEAYQAIHSRVKDRKPDAKIRGVSVAEMIEGGTEVVIGGMIDPTFGPVVMFGLGGIYVEIFEDVEFRVAPISIDEAHWMMADIDSFPLLTGARGQGCKDLNALAEMISRVGDLIYNVDKINDIDLNPVAALDEEAKALDVAISL